MYVFITITLSLLFFIPLVLASGVIEEVIISEPIRFDIDDRIEKLSIYHNIDSNLVRAIIQCESGFVEDAVGRNAHTGLDIGLFQINTFYHQDKMSELGLDIYNTKDNLEYGFLLLSRDGTKHWNASIKCWNNEYTNKIYNNG